MNNEVLLIVPSRKRQLKVVNFFNYFKDNSTITDLCLGLDDDDYFNYPVYEDVIYEINPNMNLCQKLNHISNKYASDYKYLAFMGDDHWIRTKNWDEKLVQSIEKIPNGIAYGNDLFQGPNLPTFVLMDSSVIKTLGYMCPPKQKHLYIDNFWKDLGTKLNTLVYVSDVVVEHMHFVNKKSPVDEIYASVNAAEMYEHDRVMYEQYLQNDFELDLKKFE